MVWNGSRRCIEHGTRLCIGRLFSDRKFNDRNGGADDAGTSWCVSTDIN